MVDSNFRGKGAADEFRLHLQRNWRYGSPSSDSIKFNIGVSFVERISSASVGVVARNASGGGIISSRDSIGFYSSVEVPELLSLTST